MEQLSDKAKAMKNAYNREWRRNNPDKIKEYHRRYWEKQAAAYPPEMQIKELQAQGYTQRQIADELCISLGTVNKYLKAQ